MTPQETLTYIKHSASLARYAIESGRIKYGLCKLWDIEQSVTELLGGDPNPSCPHCDDLHPQQPAPELEKGYLDGLTTSHPL